MELDEDNKPAAMEQDADNKPAAVEKNLTVAMDVDAVDKGKNTMKKQWKTLKFDEYIYEVLKQVHLDIAISGEALDMMNNIINKMMLKISEESVKSINFEVDPQQCLKGTYQPLLVNSFPNIWDVVLS